MYRLVFLRWLDRETRVDDVFFFLSLIVMVSRENERNKSLCVLMGLFWKENGVD
jgi:hypothetical protein